MHILNAVKVSSGFKKLVTAWVWEHVDSLDRVFFTATAFQTDAATDGIDCSKPLSFEEK